jgi:type I restriction enzyme S subunit
MAGEWREVTIGDLVWLHDQQITPASAPAELFYHYSIPAYDSGQRPALETGSAIGSNKFVVPRGAVLVSKLNPQLPRVWAPDIPDKARAVASTEFLVLSPRDGVDRRFLKYLMLSPAVRSAMEARVTGTSGSHQRVRPSDLLSISVDIPVDLQEQRAIAHILGTLDDKMELNRRMSETLEAMARALFKAWFVDFDPVRAKMEGRWQRGQSLPGLPAHLYDLFPDRLVDSELGEIPEGWRVGNLGDVAENLRRGVQPDCIAPNTPYIALEHMPRRCIALFDWGTAEGIESNKFEFKKGEILFGKLRPYFHKVGVAPVDGVCSTDIVVVAPRRHLWTAFVLGHLSSVEFVDYTNAASSGTKMPRTSWADMARYEIVLPPEPIAEAFNTLVQTLIERIVSGISESRALAALRDALLPKLIRGEIQVKDAERFLKERRL